jgi:3-ketosteroid 9alpha-monooxygenase subunit B
MATPAAAAARRDGRLDHAFHPLRVERIVAETAEAASFVLAVPPELRDTFVYEAGQFCTFRVWVDGERHFRSYSMSSAPYVDDEFAVTVKRVPGGVVSNWMIDTLKPGDVVEASPPTGVFCLGPHEDREIVAFCAGSGITPVYSLVKEALATTVRRARLLYANRDRDATIFAAELDDLAGRHPGRLDVEHHHDAEQGFVDAASLAPLASAAAGADVYICGPVPFMDLVEAVLAEAGVDADRIHIERFSPLEPGPPEVGGPASDGDGAGDEGPTRVTIELDGRTETTDHRPGTTILQTARQMGMAPPFSCEAGNCATCMARLAEGEVTMHVNDVLTEDEVAEGWILTCQSVPTTTEVRVVYGWED